MINRDQESEWTAGYSVMHRPLVSPCTFLHLYPFVKVGASLNVTDRVREV